MIKLTALGVTIYAGAEAFAAANALINLMGVI
jgi:hypothetical protein